MRFLDEIQIRTGWITAVRRQYVFNILDDGKPVFLRQHVPCGHGGAPYAPYDGAQQVPIGWHRTGRRSVKLEHAKGEVPWARLVHEGGGGTIAVAFDPVTSRTAPLEDLLSVADIFLRARHRDLRHLH